MVSADKANNYKLKTSAHGDTLPPPSTTDFTKSTSTPLATSTIVPTKQLNFDLFSSAEVLKVDSRGEERWCWRWRNGLRNCVTTWVPPRQFLQSTAVAGHCGVSEVCRVEAHRDVYIGNTESLACGKASGRNSSRVGFSSHRDRSSASGATFYNEQGLNRVIAVSTGSNRKYCKTSKKSGELICGVAYTPRGKFRIQWRISGWHESDLGKLYNPLYFNDGFSIHSSPSVPSKNVSHGVFEYM